jgi:hypothetical protein
MAAPRADVAELVDAHGSGPCGRKPVEVQVLSSASPDCAVSGRTPGTNPQKGASTDSSDWIALTAVMVTVLLWWFERRSRQAEVEQERIDRREQLEVDRQLREEQLRLTRTQVEGELADREAKYRAEQAAADEDEAIRRTPIRVGGHIVAEELRANAEVARRCEEGSHVPSEAQHIRLFDWWGRRGEMAGLRDEDLELWQDLERTYAALEESKKRGGYPPASHDLVELADRLDTAADGAAGSQRRETAP